jgi:AraC-like DNA-binding protein
VERSGYSHRRFIELFRDAVGLTPKRYGRVLRFRRALERVAGGRAPSWVDVALGAGYTDQPHFNRDFREFTGITPARYGELAPILPQHVPIPEARRSIPFKTRRGLQVRLAVSTKGGTRPCPYTSSSRT